jgi:hypothetical protein
MLNDIYVTNSPLPAWGGGNGGFGGPGNYSYVTSGDLADYRFSLDARAEGLAPGAPETSADFQLTIVAPDGTLGPTDGNSDRLVRLDFTLSGVSSNWQNKAVLLSKTSAGDGTSKATFTAHYAVVNEIQVQVQLNNVTASSIWQFDTDNKVFLDNVKLERLVIGCPPLGIVTSATDTIVKWDQPSSGTCKLQATSTPWIAASWADLTGATSPHTNAIASAPKYFRTKWIPPF